MDQRNRKPKCKLIPVQSLSSNDAIITFIAKERILVPENDNDLSSPALPPFLSLPISLLFFFLFLYIRGQYRLSDTLRFIADNKLLSFVSCFTPVNMLTTM